MNGARPMSERLSIPADVIEAAIEAWGDVFYAYQPQDAVRPATQAMEAAIREALDKLGLREERQEREDAVINSRGALNWLKARYISDWRPVDAEPSGPACTVCGDEKILMEPDGSKAQPCYACQPALEKASRPYPSDRVDTERQKVPSALDVLLVEKDGLSDALEKAERQRENLRLLAKSLAEQLLAAGQRLGEDGKWACDAAVESEIKRRRIIGPWARDTERAPAVEQHAEAHEALTAHQKKSAEAQALQRVELIERAREAEERAATTLRHAEVLAKALDQFLNQMPDPFGAHSVVVTGSAVEDLVGATQPTLQALGYPKEES